MRVTWQVQGFDESQIDRTYICFTVRGQLRRYDVRADNYTVREADVNEVDYDSDAVAKAKSLQGFAFDQVRIK